MIIIIIIIIIILVAVAVTAAVGLVVLVFNLSLLLHAWARCRLDTFESNQGSSNCFIFFVLPCLM